jgi:hypothetical protein
MAGRWELTDEQWGLVEPVLRGARQADIRAEAGHCVQGFARSHFQLLDQEIHGLLDAHLRGVWRWVE